MYKNLFYLILILPAILVSCDYEDLNEHHFTGQLINATTKKPEAGTKITVDVINDILGERTVSTSIQTDDSGRFEYHFKGAHKFLIFKAEEDQYCQEIDCDNRIESDIDLYTYAIIDVEQITYNTDTNFTLKRDPNLLVDTLDIRLWTYRCGQLNFQFENIAQDMDSNGLALSASEFEFCTNDESDQFIIDGQAIDQYSLTYNVYADNFFYWQRKRIDSTGTFIINDTVYIDPNSSQTIIINQAVIDNKGI